MGLNVIGSGPGILLHPAAKLAPYCQNCGLAGADRECALLSLDKVLYFVRILKNSFL
jgi:hypothetical protein